MAISGALLSVGVLSVDAGGMPDNISLDQRIAESIGQETAYRLLLARIADFPTDAKCPGRSGVRVPPITDPRGPAYPLFVDDTKRASRQRLNEWP